MGEITTADYAYHAKRLEHFGLGNASDETIRDYWNKLMADSPPARPLGLGQAILRDFFYKALLVEREIRGLQDKEVGE